MRDIQEEARIVRELTRGDSGSDPFASAVRATRMPMIITDPRLPDNPIVFVNDAFGKLTGYARSEIMGRNCRFLQGPNTDMADVDRVRDAIRARESIELDLLNYKKDGTHFWNRLLVSPVFNDDGVLLYFFASQYDVTLERERLVNLQLDRDALEAEVERRIAELQESEQRLQFALDAGRLGSWSINLDTYRLTASAECKRICGRAPTDPLTLDELRESIHPEDRQMQVDGIERAVRDRSLLDLEYRLRTPAGEERWVQIRGQASYRADGTPLALVGTTQDVTARRRAEEHRTLLANELSHRVKNTLASLQAIVSQTMRRATSVQEAGTTLEARIHAMSAANDLLISGRFESTSMRALVERTLTPFGVEDGQRFKLSGEDLQLPPRLVVAFALALHELATNAAKYGALSTADGVIDLSWKVMDGWQPHDLHLTWVESGGPPVAPPTRTSFGTQLIQRVLAHETGGTAKISYLPGGVVFEAVAPLVDSADNDNDNEQHDRAEERN
ncbi:PAS domain S-box-containing protein [Sphingomonas sp. PP-F2F-A104-K0414]|uniref:PAS domain-containing protein n=1 Tax=Sphingomonas sp. PP-F2F-A104-K0414 TaxID=2135661 RepID=UPI0010449C00|nr:PAS domain-containing protein [Sphingomonas sp. PP-F2F-A104-K0414]TCP95876.1 PAS domain S-box-containing protein [Sphingomonas sp. PP-F2F-A104-K0414]